jgi:hypothetical protein
MTFRVWFLGVISYIVLVVANQLFMFKLNTLTISGYSTQISVLPLGHLMAATLPMKKMQFPCTKWHLSLNPVPFNIKEHVLITIFFLMLDMEEFCYHSADWIRAKGSWNRFIFL